MLQQYLTNTEINFRSELISCLNSLAKRDDLIDYDGNEPDAKKLYRELGKHGLLTPNWPEQYGGRNLSTLTQAVVTEEMIRLNLPETLYVLTVHFVGGLLLLEGTTEQKCKYLPKIASGQQFFSILYSEENAGSDLTALQTQAEAIDEKHFKITGRKIYSLKSSHADYALCAARTSTAASKYQGITIFIIPLKSKNVTIKKLISLSDEQFCQVELNDVIVSQDDIVGELGQGWSVLNKAIALERTGFDFLVKAIKWYELTKKAMTKIDCENSLTDKFQLISEKLISARLFVYALLEQLDKHQQLDELQASSAKLFCSELAVEVIQFAIDHLTLIHLITNNKETNTIYKQLESAYREAPGLTLSAGTSEMMLESIARQLFN